jgi:hypothetical protein
VSTPKATRPRPILAVDPHALKIGYVYAIGNDLADWGTRQAHRVLIPPIVEMLDMYEPRTFLLPAAEASYRRSTLVTDALAAVTQEARRRDIPVYALSNAEIKRAFSLIAGTRVKNRFQVGEHVASRYAELRPTLPPHRKTYQSEAYASPLFHAVAMVVAWQTLTGAN